MQVVILAAGLGLRLKPITDKVPKCLVEVNGVSFLENELNHLSKYDNISEVIIVVGYKRRVVKNKIGNNYKGLKIRYVDSADWYKTNNIYSFWLATPFIKEDFILSEADIFFEPELLEGIFKNRDKNLVVLGKYQSYMSGSVVQLEEDGTIAGLIPSANQGKNFDYSDKYKTVNIYYFTFDFFKKHLQPNINLYAKTHIKGYWELILGVLLYLKTAEIYPYIVGNINWYEVDDHVDLARANFMFSNNEQKLDMIKNQHGGFWRYELLDFCFLTNPFFPTKEFYKEFNLPELFQNYPSCQRNIAELLSRWYTDKGFNKDNIFVGNGASEIIRILNRKIIGKILIPEPTFNEYEDVMGKSYYYLQEKDNFKLDADKFIKLVKENYCDTALLINPNNPTASLTPKKDVIKILEGLKYLRNVIVDESFITFADRKNSVQDLIEEYPNLIVIRSIGKEFGCLGLRLGYLLTTNKKVKETIKSYLPIWNINSFAERFIELFPRYEKDFKLSINKCIKEKDWLISELNKIPWLKVFPSSANFILCKSKKKDICQKLFKQGIYIKDCSNKTGLDENFLRIAVRDRKDNEKLVKELNDITN